MIHIKQFLYHLIRWALRPRHGRQSAALLRPALGPSMRAKAEVAALMTFPAEMCQVASRRSDAPSETKRLLRLYMLFATVPQKNI